MSDLDFTDLRCPLPIVRCGWSDDNSLVRSIEPCGNTLGLVTTTYQYATVGGIADGAHDHWEVRCDAGHVLFTFDDEGNDYDVPFLHEELIVALNSLNHPAVT